MVKMSSTKIIGDVRVFERCEKLRLLELSSTNVTGDVKVFGGKEFLTDLTLASTKVLGDLGDLVSENSTCRLKVLDLSNTRVSGSIFILRRAVALTELHLQDTQVTGSIDGIIGWKHASVVDLSKTMVTGRLTEHWRGCCKALRSLKLSARASVYRGAFACTLIRACVEFLLAQNHDHCIVLFLLY